MTVRSWPKEPYKGLSYYGPEDALLFAGREKDIRTCIDYLTKPRGRIMLLHGRTGCGKSSFLRAGLIPRLEADGFAYLFLRDEKDTPVFIRCTADPMDRLAEELFRFTGRKHEVKHAQGVRKIDLSDLHHTENIAEFTDKYSKPDDMVALLKAISSRFGHELIIIIDQCEEVLTLDSEGFSKNPRDDFFIFLKMFADVDVNSQIILSLRTEVFGEFFCNVRIGESVYSDIKEYLLQPLGKEAVKSAILLPTLKSPVEAGLPAPAEIYQFEYQDGLVDRIVDALFRADPSSGGILPTMQIVCRDLYNARAGAPQITDDMYRKGGEVTGPIDKHISRSLRIAFKQSGLADEGLDDEEIAWRLGLSSLVQSGPDGTAKTDVRSEAELKDDLLDAGVVSEPLAILSVLSGNDILVVRKFTILSPTQGVPVTVCSLGHDAIGLALRIWKVSYAQERKRIEAERKSKEIEGLWIARAWYGSGAVSAILIVMLISFFYGRDSYIAKYTASEANSAFDTFRSSPVEALINAVAAVRRTEPATIMRTAALSVPRGVLEKLATALPDHVLDAPAEPVGSWISPLTKTLILTDAAGNFFLGRESDGQFSKIPNTYLSPDVKCSTMSGLDERYPNQFQILSHCSGQDGGKTFLFRFGTEGGVSLVDMEGALSTGGLPLNTAFTRLAGDNIYSIRKVRSGPNADFVDISTISVATGADGRDYGTNSLSSFQIPLDTSKFRSNWLLFQSGVVVEIQSAVNEVDPAIPGIAAGAGAAANHEPVYTSVAARQVHGTKEPIWSFEKMGGVVSQCIGRSDGHACILRASGNDGNFLLVFVPAGDGKGPAASAAAGCPPEYAYVSVIDVGSGVEHDYPVSEFPKEFQVKNCRDSSSHLAFTVGGTSESVIIAFWGAQSVSVFGPQTVDLFHLTEGGMKYIGLIAKLLKSTRSILISRDGNSVFHVADKKIWVWDIDKNRNDAIASMNQETVEEVISKVCIRLGDAGSACHPSD